MTQLTEENEKLQGGNSKTGPATEEAGSPRKTLVLGMNKKIGNQMDLQSGDDTEE